MGRKAARTRQKRADIGRRALDANVAVQTRSDASPRLPPLRPRNASQENYLASIDCADIVFGIGAAGTGKTYLAVARAIQMLAEGRVGRIVLSRPAVEAEGEKLGFLPGTLRDKIEPYLLPILDVLDERLGRAGTRSMISSGAVELCPLAFMRGRTFTNACLVLDEMQNATRGQIKMALTRIGEGSMAIVTGDPAQSDLGPDDSGLLPVASALEGTAGVETVTFAREDVVRSKVVMNVLEKI